MGCSDSHALPPISRPQIAAQPNYNNQNTIFYQMQNTKKPKFLNAQPLHQQTLDALWAMIKKNSLREFAYFLETQRIPSNSEVGPANLFWNFAHFCARWDAFECLLYMIQRVYAENRTFYMSFINQQTVQGFTPLHVAIQWNAINCFHLMLDCGGTDLSYIDKSNNDVFSKARLFKRDEMLMILQRFRSGNCLMVAVQGDRTHGFKSFSQMVANGQIQERSSYRMSNERIDYVIDTRNRMNRPPPPPPAPPQEIIKKSYQNFGTNLKNIQQKRGQRQLGEGQQSGNIYMQTLLQQKKFQEEQDRIKRQKAAQLRRNIERQKMEQQESIKTQLNKQYVKQIKFEQAELQRIEKQKQIMRKNIQLMSISSSNDQINNKNQKLICPEDLKQYYQTALAKGSKFVDSQFPPQLSSIGDVSKFKFGWQNTIWLRPAQIFVGNYEVFDGISPDDIKQGSLGVCYYLALLSSIAQFPERIKKMFRFYDKDLGFYAIQLYMQGKPNTVIVDDLIPCMKGTNQPLFAKPNGKQCWVMILEKAWVKMFGNYLSSENFAPIAMFENVLPSPCSKVTIDAAKILDYYDELVQYDKKNYIMVASTTIEGDGNIGGIVAKHAYSVIGVYNLEGIRIAKVRNPWGRVQYSGSFSDESTFWSPQLSQAVGFKKGQDGQFFLTPFQMHELMCIVAISHYRQNYEYSHIEITSRSDEDIYYMITVKNRGEIAMKVTQQNERFRKDLQFENTRILFQIYKLGDNYDAQLIAQGEPATSYGGISTVYSHLKIFENYEPGKYLIRLKVYYDRAQSISTRGTYRKFIRGTDGKNPLIVRLGTSVLSLYGPQKYFFNKIESQQAFKYLKNAFRHQILTNPSTSQRMSSVGQDLKKMVVSYSLKLKHSIIYLAVNNFPNNQITFQMKFDHKVFRNASYAFGINKQTEIAEWVLPPNGGWNLCTLEVDYSEQEIATQHSLKQEFKIIR